MPRRVPTKPAPIALLPAVLLLLTGCSGDVPDRAGSHPAAVASATPTDPVEPESSATTDPTAELPFPGVAPAAGLVVAGEGASVSVPDGWRRTAALTGLDQGATGPGATLVLVDQQELGTGMDLPDLTIAQEGRIILRGMRQVDPEGHYRLAAPLDVGGVQVVHAVGTDRRGRHVERFSGAHRGRLVGLDLEVTKARLEAEPDLVASIVNSWTWQ